MFVPDSRNAAESVDMHDRLASFGSYLGNHHVPIFLPSVEKRPAEAGAPFSSSRIIQLLHGPPQYRGDAFGLRALAINPDHRLGARLAKQDPRSVRQVHLHAVLLFEVGEADAERC